MDDHRAHDHPPATTDDSKPTRHDLSKPTKHDTLRYQKCKTSLTGEGHHPQQADLLQVVQDVNGRFVASVAMQLRKRAANLCCQELKEYKRSKKLNILVISAEADAAGSQPSKASYLIPALPHDDPAARTSEPSQRRVPCRRHTSASEQGYQASAHVRSDVDRKAPVHQLKAASPPPIESVMVSPFPAPHEQALSNLPASLQTDPGPTNPSHCMQRPSAAPNAVEPMPVAAAYVSSYGHASHPAEPSDCLLRSSTNKQQCLHLPKQQGSVPSWSQDGSQQRAHHWEHTTSQNFAQAKLTCTPSFPFSKQPCVVMW